ncbi:uncharacterized protein E0L32_008540 [Thyridium curvatum]|uniref:Uncharacterized protein n=1 Tax=Thyridium curvatum TaxID=1093900 RepID=A0A507B1R0_9PEZI|nr:uncharacterized protein E0L32_008540 [Thyridium curvatum]TPX10490.1 hypothetical protein E0L32_008540 [Thyridium curvatum]
MAALAPSSPRLPSPPPPAEDQIGPTSPSMGSAMTLEAQQMEQTLLNANSKRRIHPGTKAANFAAGPPLVPLNELDSAFQLQEHLAALHYHHTASNTQPINRETAQLLATPPPGIDRTLWLYELCRFLISQCNSLIVGFLFDAPPCSAATCPEMRASEWQFLCAVHDQPKSCCAIDYCCHTLDWAANVVTNPKIFPSRFSLAGADVALDSRAGGGSSGAATAVKNLVNVFRRLHRIFAHAWFQHRGVFWSVEGQTGLYVFFKTVCDLYDLLPAENYKLPPEAEGLEAPNLGGFSSDGAGGDKRSSIVPTSIAKPPAQRESLGEDLQPVGRTNTRRHIRSSPSTGSAVTTVMEQDEDDHGDVVGKLKEMRISAPHSAEGEPDVAEVPVIVEHGPAGRPQHSSAASHQEGVKPVGQESDSEGTTVHEAPEGSTSADELRNVAGSSSSQPEVTEVEVGASDEEDEASPHAKHEPETVDVQGAGDEKSTPVDNLDPTAGKEEASAADATTSGPGEDTEKDGQPGEKDKLQKGEEEPEEPAGSEPASDPKPEGTA